MLNSSLIRCQVMNYLFGLDLYFKNAGNAIKDKEQDVFKNMLEMTLRSRNELLKQSVSNIFERNIMEAGGCDLGVSKNDMNDKSIYSSLKLSDIKYDKKFLRRGIAEFKKRILHLSEISGAL